MKLLEESECEGKDDYSGRHALPDDLWVAHSLLLVWVAWFKSEAIEGCQKLQFSSYLYLLIFLGKGIEENNNSQRRIRTGLLFFYDGFWGFYPLFTEPPTSLYKLTFGASATNLTSLKDCRCLVHS
ncbi:hypothetical protein ACET3Z_026299 [Daucus carota]